jgi:hypothetical protein
MPVQDCVINTDAEGFSLNRFRFKALSRRGHRKAAHFRCLNKKWHSQRAPQSQVRKSVLLNSVHASRWRYRPNEHFIGCEYSGQRSAQPIP